jgi:hypothetical protein
MTAAKKAAAPSTKRFRVLAGLDYRSAAGAPLRAEPGDVVEDLSPTDVGWLLDCGAIEGAD